MEIMKNNFESLQKGLSSYSYDDAATASTIHRVYKTNDYILDPHGAIAFLAAEQFIKEQEGARAIILETAHPVKFPEVVEEAIGQTIEIPDSVKYLLGKEKVAIPIGASFAGFKDWMLSKVGS
jgi:threonine synthase